ncbi:IS5 family transposase [Roseivivax halodurans]|nr:IS5 family transposase [Roseivivax halodurans]
MSRLLPPSYTTKNWPCYNEALKQRGSLTIWFDPDLVWVPPPTGKRGRQARYRDEENQETVRGTVSPTSAIQTCLTMKVLFGMALRQTTGFVQSLLSLVGLDWDVPDFSTLRRRQKTLAVAIPYRGSQGALNLLIDSTGIKAEGEGEWHARKHGGAKRRLWRKIHIGVDEQTLEIRAIEVTGSRVGDAPFVGETVPRTVSRSSSLPELLDQIPADEEVASVTADGAYDTRKCHNAVADRGAHAVIPPRKNAKPWKPSTAGAIARKEALRASKYLGRAIWRKWSGYHRRSRAETKMHCVKLLGQSLMARDFDRQVAELQVRAAVLNGYIALGIPVTEPTG